MLVAQPLTIAESQVLRAYAMGAVPEPHSAAERVEWAATTRGLIAVELLARVGKRGILVTPEGLAAVLSTVPVEIMRTEAPLGASAPVSRDAPTRLSRAARTSAGSSSRRDRAAN